MIGLRYYRARRDNGFISLISLVSFFGLALGVTALVVVVSVMNGFDRELKHRILGAVPHVLVESDDVDAVRSLTAGMKVAAVTPFREVQVLLLTGDGSHLVTLYGIDPLLEEGASILPEAIVTGSLASLTDSPLLEVVLGGAVARRFGLREGDNFNLVVPRVSRVGETIIPALFNARLVGTLSVGSELDYVLGIMHIDDLALLDVPRSRVRVSVSDIFAAPAVAVRLNEAGLAASDWTDRFGDFFKTVRMEKIMMFVLLLFVVAIAAFSIVSGLSMLVQSKRRDIAVLRTMGLTESGVMQVFLIQGLGISTLGVVTGLLIGVPMAIYTPQIMGLLSSLIGVSIVEGTYFDQIPSEVRLTDTFVIALTAFVIGFSATLYPALRASRLEPAEVLRYE